MRRNLIWKSDFDKSVVLDNFNLREWIQSDSEEEWNVLII